jgi:hypothetical protein
MKLISHRGNLQGPDPSEENSPDLVLDVLEKGFDCEVDFWLYKNKLYLGHDEPEYQITQDFIQTPRLWVHAKNFDAMFYLYNYKNINFFWHQEDDFTITSKGYIWTYPGKPLAEISIAVMPERVMNISNIKSLLVLGVCSDYIGIINE